MSALNFVAGSTCYKNSNYVRVGHGSSLYNDAVWSFQLGDGSMASINSVRINFQWNNADAGEGWSSDQQYEFDLSTNGGDARIACNDPNSVGYAFKNIVGSYGAGSVDITGLSLAPGVTYYLRCNLNGSTLSTLKNFGKTAQSISLLSYTPGTPPTPDNSKPYWSGGTCALDVPSIFSEAIGVINVSWAGAYDVDGDTLWYDVVRVTSNHGTKQIYQGTDTTCSDSAFTYDDAQVEVGQSVYYNVTVQDEHGSWAQTVIQSPVVTRNSMSPASLSFVLEHQIGFNTDEFLCHRTDPAELLPESNFTYNLTCDKVTVYNPTVDIKNTGDPSSILIWRTGDAVPTTPYIIFTELVVALRNTYYKGTLMFTLTTTNSFGTTKSSVAYINVDISVAPLWVAPNVQYSGGYTINNHLYYLPDVRGITVSWAAAIEQLEGQQVYYDLEYKLSSALDWMKVVFETSSLSAVISPPSNDVQLTYEIRLTAKTTYGTQIQIQVQSLVIDKYLRPIFGLTSKKRNSTSVALVLNITTRTTILAGDYSITTLDFLKCDKTTRVNLPTTSWKPSFEYGVSPYADASFTKFTSYTMVCRFNDSLGAVFGGQYATVLTLSIPINSYVPMFSIRKKGVAVNDINDGVGNFILKIKGKINSITDDLGLFGYYENGFKVPVPVPVANYSSGCLIDLGDAATAATQSWQITLKIFGNCGFNKNASIDTIAQANYRPNSTYMGYVQINNGLSIPGVKFFTDSGRIKAWFKQTDDWQVLYITAYNASSALPITVTNAVEPTGTNKVQCAVRSASTEVFNAIYPIGSIYMSVGSTNPATLFGGTWAQLQNVFLLGAGSIAAAGVTGGEQNHTLSMSEIPLYDLWVSSPGYSPGLDVAFNGGSNYGICTLNSGGGQPHNNMPPYLSVYMWTRTA